MKLRLNNIIILLFIISIMVLNSSCNSEQVVNEKKEVVENVVVFDIQPETLVEEFTLTGVVKAAKDIIIASELGGPVEWIGVNEGEIVSENQILAKVNLKSLKAAFDQAEAQHELAKISYQRQKKLFEKKLISPGQMDKYNADFKVAEANLEAARVRHEKGQLRSPINGHLDKFDLDVGEIILPGQVAGRIIDVQEIEIHVSLPEKDVNDAKKGDAVSIHIISRPEELFTGRVSFVAIATENINKTFVTKIIADNSQRVFRPGMIVNVTFRRNPRKNRIVIPQTAVLTKEGRKWVFTVKNDIAQEQEILTGAVVKEKIEITKGLKSGDLVVTTGQYTLIDGDKVKIVKKINNMKDTRSSILDTR